jgi:acetylglutamate kinase
MGRTSGTGRNADYPETEWLIMKDEHIYIIKVGGNIIDDESKLSAFLSSFASFSGKKILVHGGGKLATKLAADLHIPQQMVDGRRITDADTLKIVTMVYAGFINKNIVAELQAKHCQAIGLCGADANIIRAHKRNHPSMDFGFVGDVDSIDTNKLTVLLESGLTIVIAPITHDGRGQLLNTNADTIAQEIAKALAETYSVTLVYCFEKAGVLLDADDEQTLIPSINPARFEKLKLEKKIFAGMIPKLENAFTALASGVHKVIIGKAEAWDDLIAGKSGTTIEQ